MPLGTLDRQPPPFFRQGASALSRLLVCSALAILLMVSDSRFALIEPVRAVIATLLYPLQWLVLQPVLAVRAFGEYTESRDTAQQREQAAQAQLLAQSVRAQQVEQLRLENAQLRRLLELRGQTPPPATAAQVLYEALDPFSRKLIIDKGQMQGIAAGSPVVDAQGVVGQVTRVYPLLSEVTLIVAPEHAIPVLNTRTGTRSV
ncbi:MAG: rod shape-determining protein MreC, partial [Betaproteobacteria bacterium]|nr:rod shape-determining protein MreC [Betaproteobacteria bacterium]